MPLRGLRMAPFVATCFVLMLAPTVLIAAPADAAIACSDRAPQPGSFATLCVTRIRIRDAETTDRVRMRGEFALAAGSQGIDPAAEPVSLRLSTPAGVFYHLSVGPGSFDTRGTPGNRRWVLTDTARDSTGVERLVILEQGEFILVERPVNLPTLAFSSTTFELIIGATFGSVNMEMVESPPGSGSWRLK